MQQWVGGRIDDGVILPMEDTGGLGRGVYYQGQGPSTWLTHRTIDLLILCALKELRTTHRTLYSPFIYSVLWPSYVPGPCDWGKAGTDTSLFPGDHVYKFVLIHLSHSDTNNYAFYRELESSVKPSQGLVWQKFQEQLTFNGWYSFKQSTTMRTI